MMTPTQSIFEQVLLRPIVPDGAGLAHLSWRVATGTADHRVQIYVNGRWHDVTGDAHQRSVWLHLDRTREARVELLAVDEREMWIDHAAALEGGTPMWRTDAGLAMVRDESLPTDARMIVSVDGEEDAGHALWRSMDDRSGFGGLFGVGGLGFDDAASPGFALGEFAVGAFGIDDRAWRWRRDDLAPGEHTIALRAMDSRGRALGSLDEPQVLTIDVLPRPATHVTLDDTFTLHWD